ncbi:MAG: hypothetical protein ACREOS_05290, partial [Candidatus Dormibacteraceae bacterium]
MDSSLIVLGAASCSAVAMFCLVVGITLMRRPDAVRERMNELLPAPRSLEEFELQQPFSQRVARPFVRGLARLVLSRTPQSTIDGIRRDLLVGGSPGNLDVRDFLGIKGLSGLACGALATFVLSESQPSIFVAAGGVVGVFIGYM